MLAFITLKDSGSESNECCCDEPHDFFESYQRLKATIAHANIGSTTLSPELMENVNSCGTGWKIVWWGTFLDLCSGKDDFRQSIIDCYLNGFDDATNRSLITDADHIREFMDVVKRYGQE